MKMTLKNGDIIDEMNKIFERMHVRLDQRFRQLTREVNTHTTSMIHSHKKNDRTLSFCPINELQLEHSINNFGCLTISKCLDDIPWCESVLTNTTSTPYATDSISSMSRSTMKKTASISTIIDENARSNDQCQIIGKHGRQRGQFSNPQDVLIINNLNRTLLVSDTINQNVQLFSIETGLCTGTLLSSSATKQSPFRRPIGLANTFNNHNSTCLVTDYEQHLISSWTIDENGNGKFVKKFGQQTLLGPKGLCVSNQSQRIVVADNKANRICLFDSAGLFLHHFGTRGAEEYELAGPHYVKFMEQDNDQQIIVTDFYNNAVKIFDLERQGQLVRSFGSFGTKHGQFQSPTGLSIDYERGYIFVADWGNSRVQVFDRQGLFIRIIELSITDMLYGPQGLGYEPISHTLAITNPGKHSILLVHID